MGIWVSSLCLGSCCQFRYCAAMEGKEGHVGWREGGTWRKGGSSNLKASDGDMWTRQLGMNRKIFTFEIVKETERK